MAAPTGATALDTRLFVAPALATAVVEEHLVALDLAAGEYAVFDRVATRVWHYLISEPPSRSSATEFAEMLGAELPVVEHDTLVFSEAQIRDGRLTRFPPPRPGGPARPVPRLPAFIGCAWWFRLRADQLLKRSFAEAYRVMAVPAAHISEPRMSLAAVLARFGTAENLYPSRRAPLDCLPRSLALTRFLRCAGWPAEHVIGVRLFPFEAHAWVEVDDAPVHERSDIGDIYTVIHRQP